MMNFFSNLRIGTRLALGFGLVLALTVIASTVALVTARKNAEATRQMMESPLAKERLVSLIIWPEPQQVDIWIDDIRFEP